MRLLLSKLGICAFAAALSLAAIAQDSGIIGPSPYEYTTETWMQPFAEEGMTWGGTSGVYVQNKDRIFFLQRGETRLPSPVPESYTRFPGSIGWNVLRGRGRVWQNCIYVVNSEGEVLEVWDQWDHLFKGTFGPGPHRLRMSPYDPENRLWLVDETNHIIYVFSNDGERLMMTLGEKGIEGKDETHYRLPQDVAFLPNGMFLVGDGLGGNNRIVVRNADGTYRSEFGEGGDAIHQFASVHSLAMGPDQKLYALDRDKRDVKVFRQTAALDSADYPNYQYETTWTGLDLPLDITVSDDAAWVTDIRPPKIVKFNLDGQPEYTWRLPVEGPHMWIEMHSLAADEEGNLYGTDNQAGRPQKMVPHFDANPEHLVRRPYYER
ncbi:MAG: hypothetical protein MI746_14780 [Pseudomonadales bacterium]|nr:hypothetical protein [Pseudomonadales bacterium]